MFSVSLVPVAVFVYATPLVSRTPQSSTHSPYSQQMLSLPPSHPPRISCWVHLCPDADFGLDLDCCGCGPRCSTASSGKTHLTFARRATLRVYCTSHAFRPASTAPPGHRLSMVDCCNIAFSRVRGICSSAVVFRVSTTWIRKAGCVLYSSVLPSLVYVAPRRFGFGSHWPLSSSCYRCELTLTR